VENSRYVVKECWQKVRGEGIANIADDRRSWPGCKQESGLGVCGEGRGYKAYVEKAGAIKRMRVDDGGLMAFSTFPCV
jgi:hypothetical protein